MKIPDLKLGILKKELGYRGLGKVEVKDCWVKKRATSQKSATPLVAPPNCISLFLQSPMPLSQGI